MLDARDDEPPELASNETDNGTEDEPIVEIVEGDNGRIIDCELEDRLAEVRDGDEVPLDAPPDDEDPWPMFEEIEETLADARLHELVEPLGEDVGLLPATGPVEPVRELLVAAADKAGKICDAGMLEDVDSELGLELPRDSEDCAAESASVTPFAMEKLVAALVRGVCDPDEEKLDASLLDDSSDSDSARDVVVTVGDATDIDRSRRDELVSSVSIDGELRADALLGGSNALSETDKESSV